MATFADADGTRATVEHVPDQGRCIMCGHSCTIQMLGIRIHIPCWERSTAATRRAALDRATGNTPTPAAQQPPAPAVPVAPPETPTPSEPEVATPQAPPAGAPARSTVPYTAPGQFAAPAAILDTDALYIGSERHDFPATPLNHVGHVARLVRDLQLGTQISPRRAEPGQIWLTFDLLRDHFGVDLTDAQSVKLSDRERAVRGYTSTTKFVTDAIADGWNFGGGDNDALGIWTRVWRGEEPAVWVALIPAMARPESDMAARLPFLVDNPSPSTIGRRLAAFAAATHMPWVLSGSTTGLNLAKHLRPNDSKEVFGPHDPPQPAQYAWVEADFSWHRRPTADELKSHRFIHGYDRGGSYLAGVLSLELGIGEWTHHPGGKPFDKKLPGYHLVEVPEAADTRYPHPLNPRGRIPDGPTWVTTPTLQHAYELGFEVEVIEAYTWEQHGRYLDEWSNHLRDARMSLDVDDPDLARARDAVKAVYTETIGLMASKIYMEGRPGYAPHWRHHIQGRARTNILRRVIQIGKMPPSPQQPPTARWPIAILRDTVFYTSDDPNPETAWPGLVKDFGRGLGQYKPEVSGLLAEQVGFFEQSEYHGKPKLTDVTDWAPDEHRDAAYLEDPQ